MMIQAVLLIVGALIGTGLLFGSVMALVAVSATHDRAEAVLWIVNGYYLLASLMPLVLWRVLSVLSNRAAYGAVFASRWRALLTTVQGALVGSMLGAGPLFFAVVVYVSSFMVGYDRGSLDGVVRDQILWSRLLIVVGATVGAAFPLGLWANFVGADWKDR